MRIKELLREAKARIEHPEDLIFHAGSQGAISAVNALTNAINNKGSLSIKFDGSTALVAGYDEHGFTCTDKSGFSKANGAELARTPKELQSIIINRSPDQPGRRVYASQLANMFVQVSKIIPKNFLGFIQFDVLWFSTPTIKNGNLVFQPNKVVYSVPVDSDLGKKIARSDMGIVIHSYFKSRSENEPVAVTDISTLNLIQNSKLAVLDTKMIIEPKDNTKFDIIAQKLLGFITKNSNVIDSFVDRPTLQLLKISNLPDLMKSFLARQASAGTDISSDISKMFIDWIKTNSQVTDTKRATILDYIQKNQNGFSVTFKIVLAIVRYKNLIISDLTNSKSQVGATLHDEPGHEGYVSDSEHGRIKLVNRPKFMRHGDE